MKYCDKCGAAVPHGGHSAIFRNFKERFLCDKCYAAQENAVLGVGRIVGRIVVGFVVGMTAGSLCGMGLFSAITSIPFLGDLEVSYAGQRNFLIGIVVVLVVLYIACKIARVRIRNGFLKFILGVAAYLVFWTAMMIALASSFVLKAGGV